MSETKKSNKKSTEVTEIIESTAVVDEIIDTSLFVENVDGSTSRFALLLIQHLQDENLLKLWISCNRPCFALVYICKVPSARKIAITALKMYKKEIEISAALHAGGKLLLAEINI